MAKIIKDTVLIVTRAVKSAGVEMTRVYAIPKSGAVTRPAPFGKPGRIVDVQRSIVWTIGDRPQQVAQRYIDDGYPVAAAA